MTVLLVPEEQDAAKLLSVMDRNPLGQRAWTLQERLLSPRVLDHGDVRTRWQCPETIKLEKPVGTDVWVEETLVNWMPLHRL